MSDLAKPSEKPRWATDVGASITTPPTEKQDAGWVVEYPPHQFFNWLSRWTYEWLNYLEAKSDTDLGGQAETALTIASGSITPVAGIHRIDTEGAESTDDLTHIALTNLQDGRLLLLRSVNAARVITLKHEAGGSGQISLRLNADVLLNDPKKWIMLTRNGTQWVEVMRSFLEVHSHTTAEDGGQLDHESLSNNGVRSHSDIDADLDALEIQLDQTVGVEPAAPTVTKLRYYSTTNSEGFYSKDTRGIVFPVSRKYNSPSEYTRRMFAHGESSHIGSYSYEKLNDERAILASGTPSTWLADLNADAQPKLDIYTPFGVLIGDSIMEGHPQLHGRLHTAGGTIDLNYQNSEGQLSYELSTLTNMYWYNHGIGGQTTVDVRSRWARDVLADQSGSPTLPQKPIVAIIGCGVNDVQYGVDINVTKQNLAYFAKSCRDNRIKAAFMPIAQASNWSAEWKQIMRDINEWMYENLPRWGATVIEDYYEWAQNPANPNQVPPWLYIDDIHPSRGGHKALARFIISKIDFPIFFHGLQIEIIEDPDNLVNPYSRVKELEISHVTSGEKYTMVLPNKENHRIPMRLSPPINERVIRLTIKSAYAIRGGGRYIGFSGIKAVLKNKEFTPIVEKLTSNIAAVTTTGVGSAAAAATLSLGCGRWLIIANGAGYNGTRPTTSLVSAGVSIRNVTAGLTIASQPYIAAWWPSATSDETSNFPISILAFAEISTDGSQVSLFIECNDIGGAGGAPTVNSRAVANGFYAVKLGDFN